MHLVLIMPSVLAAAGGRTPPLKVEARLQLTKAVKALWPVPAEAPSLWLLAGAAAGTAPLGQLLGVVSVLAASRTWCLQQGTQEQPLISRKLTKGPSFRRVKAQGAPNTHHRLL